MSLPIDDILPEVVSAVRAHGRAVLQAPPGAGKTTRVPLALLEAIEGKIIMLEPRRLAARAAAERLAEQLGEKPGQTVGYRMRGATKAGKRIEVVTEGILTRMIQTDPELTGIGAVIFDEFHERSLQADLGLALCLEIRAALRPDLALIAMSATLDAAPVAALMDDAPILTSEGRSYPVEEVWLDRPSKARRIEEPCADLVVQALTEQEGSALVFLPGAPEIRRVETLLKGRLTDTDLRPLYGGLPFATQRAAIEPGPRRKVVLATSIAETSLTIEDIRIVIDAGRARRSRFDPGSGMSRLVTERVTRAEATQRAGRAGRVAPGTAYKLWTKGEDGALMAAPPPEIAAADLASLALDLALWGSADLPFLTPPPQTALSEARALLTDLGALDARGGITRHGRTLAAMPLHPRLAHMLAIAGAGAAPLAALLSDRDPLRDRGSDLALRLKALPKDPAFATIRAEAARLAKTAPAKPALSAAEEAALAYPDRIALRRAGDAPRYLLSGGKGAYLRDDDPLAGQRLLVACDLDGDAREARIRLATPLPESALRALYVDRIAWHDVCHWSKREGRVVARRQERFGALVLDDRIWKDAPADAIARAMLDGIRELGLRLDGPAALFRTRVETVRAADHPLPAMDDNTLLETLETWLLPHLSGVKTAEDWRRFDPLPALRAMLDWDETQRLDHLAPASFRTPTGRSVPVDYAGETPAISVKLQEMFGQSIHPTVAGQPVQITLLSPAGRPLQVTSNLPGFWSGAYADVRKDMRGRYPKHPWPEDPLSAEPTLRVKRRS